MATAGKFRAEAAGMREFARTVTDPEILAEIEAMIAEWERRARALGNGDGAECTPEVSVRRLAGHHGELARQLPPLVQRQT